MGLVCALVYLLAVVNFLPFAFKRDIAELTSISKDATLEAQQIETGRFLHRFPLEKVRILSIDQPTLRLTCASSSLPMDLHMAR